MKNAKWSKFIMEVSVDSVGIFSNNQHEEISKNNHYVILKTPIDILFVSGIIHILMLIGIQKSLQPLQSYVYWLAQWQIW